MQYRRLGKTGLNVSVIGFGGIPVQRISSLEASRLVNRALDLGINFFDTARAYTDSEAKLGPVLRERRSEVYIATKSLARTRAEMEADIEKSLKTMGLESIDLYQVHNVKDPETMDQILNPGGAMEALRAAQKGGVVKHIGLTSHIKNMVLNAIRQEVFTTVQFPFNATETDGAEEILQAARQNNVGVIVMKPLGGGSFTNAAQALRFILEYPVTTVIPGMDSLDQVEENAAIGGSPEPLTDDERSQLMAAVAKLGATFCRRCEYCLPCAQGIDIPGVFLLDGYYVRYNLKDWARARYRNMVKTDACLQCGECEERCPYSLPISQMLAEAGARLDS
jgi:predicted aldo/keto reductase-like oxidoreductase